MSKLNNCRTIFFFKIQFPFWSCVYCLRLGLDWSPETVISSLQVFCYKSVFVRRFNKYSWLFMLALLWVFAKGTWYYNQNRCSVLDKTICFNGARNVNVTTVCSALTWQTMNLEHFIDLLGLNENLDEIFQKSHSVSRLLSVAGVSGIGALWRTGELW